MNRQQNPPITPPVTAAAVNRLIVTFGHFTDEAELQRSRSGGDPRRGVGRRSVFTTRRPDLTLAVQRRCRSALALRRSVWHLKTFASP